MENAEKILRYYRAEAAQQNDLLIGRLAQAEAVIEQQTETITILKQQIKAGEDQNDSTSAHSVDKQNSQNHEAGND